MKTIIGKSYLKEIPHEGGKILFSHLPFKDRLEQVAKVIDQEGLKRPNSAQTASLVYDDFQNTKGKTESEIIKILKTNWLWEFTGNYYLPKEKGDIQNGVILQDNPLIKNKELIMNKNDLIEKLYDAEEFRINKHSIFISKDRSVRFVPFGYKIEKQTWQELEINPYMIARYLGRKNNELEGAQKISEVASKSKEQPYLWSFDSVDQEKTRISTLYDSWHLLLGLDICGDNWNDNRKGHAFGVCKEKEEKVWLA